MCGIVGIWNYKSQRQVSKNTLTAMCEALSHRGPDGEGIELDKDLGFGHRRLSIIDLAGNRQPMSDANNRVMVTFNGEIYNYKELRRELEQDGIQLKTDGDTEVIPYFYLKYGVDFVKHLEGMFAIALWDRQQEVLLLIRDRVGKKPLLYAETESGVAFSSEMQSLVKADGVNKQISPEALDAYMTLAYIPHTQCIFEGVKKVPPATVLVFNRQGLQSSQRYWQLDLDKKSQLDLPEAKQQLHDLLIDNVRKRLVADVPLGAFLSGGTDSSLIAAIASEIGGNKLQTFCIGFSEQAFDERADARAVANVLGTDHHEDVVEFDGINSLPRLQKNYGEPFADESAIATYFLCENLRKDVTVAISGDGGDELFLGYNRYKRLNARYAVHQWVKHLPGTSALARASHQRKSQGHNNLARIINLFQDSALPAHQQFVGSVSVFRTTARQELYSAHFRNSLETYGSADRRVADLFEQFKQRPFLEQCGFVDQNLYMVDDILAKVDIASMAASLEVRAPLLDHSVVEFAAALPLQHKMSSTRSKILLKELLKDYLPQTLIDKPKQGFAVPVGEWIKTDMQSMTKELLLSDGGFIAQNFNQDLIARMLKQHTHGNKSFSKQLWVLLCLAVWAEQFGLS